MSQQYKVTGHLHDGSPLVIPISPSPPPAGINDRTASPRRNRIHLGQKTPPESVHGFENDLLSDETATYEKSPWNKTPHWKRTPCSETVPRRVRRYMMLHILLFVGAGLTCWFLIRPIIHTIFNTRHPSDLLTQNSFGKNKMPHFPGMVKVKKLDRSKLPLEGHGVKQRLVVIGDVHGCKDELMDLLKEVSYDDDNDHAIFVGDLINKGPDSIAVVELVRRMGASCVRGNHEDRVLLAWKEMQDDAARLDFWAEKIQNPADLKNLIDEKRNERDRRLAAKFTPKAIEWLQKCPVILHVGFIQGMGELHVVHAGMVPGLPLEDQDPGLSMNMRTIDPETNVPSEERDGICWAESWNAHQRELPVEKRATVIYGHDSRRGLAIREYTKGLDTGCVKGNRLTALVISAGEEGQDVTQKLVSVPCKSHLKVELQGSDNEDSTAEHSPVE